MNLIEINQADNGFVINSYNVRKGESCTIVTKTRQQLFKELKKLLPIEKDVKSQKPVDIS